MSRRDLEASLQVHDEHCERVVLGTILTSGNALNEVREILSPECFYEKSHREVYKAILNVADKGDIPDIITVMAELRTTDSEVTPFDLAQLSTNFTTGSAYTYAARLHDLEKRRKFWEIGQWLTTAGISEEQDIVDVQQQAKEKIDGIFEETPGSVVTLRDALQGMYDNINLNLKSDGIITGTPTGFEKLDSKGGLHKSDLIIVAGTTSQGKTSFVQSIVLNAMRSGGKVAFYSLEMTKIQLAARLTASISGVSSNDILYNQLTDMQLKQVDVAVGKMQLENLYFDDRSTSNIDSILTSIRSMKLKHNINGAVVDYLQILNVNMRGTNKEQQMGDVARRLKNLAKDLGIWIIALSQLNRDNQNPVPSLDRLRDSGQIAEAADVVILIYRPEIYNKKFPQPFEKADTKGMAMIDVAKGRNIGIMKFLCRFDNRLTLFSDVDEIPVNQIITEEEPF